MVPNNHGRHAAVRPQGRRRVPATIAALAVVALALGGWAVAARGGDDAGTGAASRIGTAAAAGADADRGGPAALAPPEGGLFPAPTTTRPTTARPTTARPTTAAPTRSAAATATRAPATTAAPATAPSAADEVTRLTNAERAKAGCAAVRTDARLAAAAQAHSKDMVDRNYFSHTSPDGRGPGDRATAAGYPSWSGENIAAGYPTPAEVVRGWMDSPGHRANILNCQSTATGVGFDPRKNMWTQMFGFV